MKRAVASLLVGAACAACSTLGTGPGSPEGLPHGGIGPFRIRPGATLRERRTIESGMVAGRYLFYAGAQPLAQSDGGIDDSGIDDSGIDDSGIDDGGIDDSGIDDSGIDDGSVSIDGGRDAGRRDAGAIDAGPRIVVPDWSGHEPRAIYRSAPRADGAQRWDEGTEVLSAAEPWEGGYVHDPWAISLPDGSVLLYYAAEGGIGVARANGLDGAFIRTGGAPVIARPGARRPSVVRTDGMAQARAFLMYVELEGRILALASDDGLRWGELGELSLPALPPRDERDSIEIAIGSPGALAARTPAGRAVLRLYYESRRADGQVLLAVAGSFDGLSFETCPDPPLDGARCSSQLPIVDSRDTTMPAPRQLDARITLLEVIARGRMALPELRTGIAPAGAEQPASSP